MPLSMLLYNKMENTVTMITFITTASILLFGICLFTILLFFDKKIFQNKSNKVTPGSITNKRGDL